MPAKSPHSSPPSPPPSADWLFARIDRRRFIQGASLATAALFFLPGASLLAAKNKTKATAAKTLKNPKPLAFPPTPDYALNPIRTALDQWKAPQAAIPATGPVTLDFDIAFWNKSAAAAKQSVDISKLAVGHMRIARAPGAAGAIRYTIKRDLLETTSHAEITCRAPAASGIEQVESWTAQWPGVAQTGAVRDGAIHITTNKAQRTLPLPAAADSAAPLIADASLYGNPALPALLAAACAAGGAGKTFTRLDQSLYLCENQRLRPDIPVTAPWDSAITLQSWLLTGDAIPPTNILTDPDHRTLFSTAFMLGTALHAIV